MKESINSLKRTEKIKRFQIELTFIAVRRIRWEIFRTIFHKLREARNGKDRGPR